MTPDDLKTWRKAQGWTQSQAAQALGITQQVYARHESGVVKIDTRTALACAALAAGLNPWHASTADKRAF